MKLRPYQEAAILAVRDALNSGMSTPLVCLPTGSGKSPVLTTLVSSVAAKSPGRKFLVLVHTQELIKQLAETYERVSGVKPGIFSASVGKKHHDEQVTIAQVQSFVRNKRRFNNYKLVVVDECDRIGPDENSNYRKLISDLKVCNPEVRIVGLTATPYRTGQGLCYGEDRVFDDLVYDANIKELIEQGYLSSLVGKDGGTPDLSDLHIRKGDYVASELEDFMSNEARVSAAIREIVKYSPGRKKILIFASGIKHANMVSDALKAVGIYCPVITGDMPKADRDLKIGAFKAAETSYLVNINVLSVGFDAPDIDMIVLLRPTKSPGLYYQQIGRGMRIHPNKKDCLVLDMSGNIQEHGPIDQLNDRIKKRKSAKGEGEALSKTCPDCKSICALACKECEDCGHIFVPLEQEVVKHATKAYDESPLSAPQKWEEVTAAYHRPYKKKVECLWVTYTCGLGARVSDFLPLDGYGRAKLLKFVRESEDTTKDPRLVVVNGVLTTTRGDKISFDNIEEWCKTLKVPTKILPCVNGKYRNVAARSFDETPRAS